EIILLPNTAPSDSLADRKAVLRMDEGDIIDDEHAGFANGREIFEDALRADQAIASAIKGPGAAERAIPRTATREFDRSGWIKNADKVFSRVPEEIPPWLLTVELLNYPRRRPLAVRRHPPREFG